jgi:hypothetical protein
MARSTSTSPAKRVFERPFNSSSNSGSAVGLGAEVGVGVEVEVAVEVGAGIEVDLALRSAHAHSYFRFFSRVDALRCVLNELAAAKLRRSVHVRHIHV